MIMKFNGTGDELIIGTIITNNHFSYTDVVPHPFFSNLSINTTPTVTSSLRHTISDNKFVGEESFSLLK